MSYILFKGSLIWLHIFCIADYMKHYSVKGFHHHHHPPPIPHFPSAGSLSGPGPISGPGITAPGPIGPTGSFGPSAIGPGSIGPGHFPGPFGFGPLGNFPFPLFPLHPHGPCNFLKSIRKYLPHLVHPILIGGVAIIIFLIFKNIFLPHLGFFAIRMSRALGEADQTVINHLTYSIRSAISKGICLERLACQIGRKSSNYKISPSIIDVIKSHPTNGNSLVEIFKVAASGDISSCDHYVCWEGTKNSTNHSPYKYNNTINENEILILEHT